MKSYAKSKVSLLALALGQIFAGEAIAQPASPVASASAGTSEGEILVTARRREERAQDVPVALTAYSTEELSRYNTSSLQQVSARTPGLILAPTANLTGGVVNLRGVGSADAGPGIDQAVSIAIDGIMFSQATFLRLGLYDLDRIEVLKGPQTLFYGKNSPGGVISIVSASPGEDFEAKARVGYEFYDKKKFIEGTISTPITESFGLRVNGYYGSQKGWLRNTAESFDAIAQPNGTIVGPGPGTSQRTGPDGENYSLRGTLAFSSPGGLMDAKLKVSYGKQDDNNGFASRVQNAYCVGGAPQLVVQMGIPGAGNRDCKLDRYYNESDVSPQIRALHPLLDKGRRYDVSHQFLTSLNVDLHLTDGLTLTSLTGFAKSREVSTGNFAYYGLSGVEAYLNLYQRQLSQ